MVTMRTFNTVEFAVQYGSLRVFDSVEAYLEFCRSTCVMLLRRGINPISDAFKPAWFYAGRLRLLAAFDVVGKVRADSGGWSWFSSPPRRLPVVLVPRLRSRSLHFFSLRSPFPPPLSLGYWSPSCPGNPQAVR